MACCNNKPNTEVCNTGSGNTWFLIILVLFILLAVMFGSVGW